MSSATDSAKGVVERGKSVFAEQRERRPWLDHIVNTVQRYNSRHGNVYAASISFNGIIALVPILMVVFAVAAFVLAADPNLLDSLKDSIVDAAPGKMGSQLGDVIDSSIKSRAAVGVIGLIGAGFTGIGWISGVRVAFTQMYGGQVSRNPVMSKVWDLLTFVLLGVAFAATMAISAVANSSLTTTILSAIGLGHFFWAPAVVRVVSIVISIAASWMLFTFVLAKLPLVEVPFRNCLRAGLATGVIFEILKAVGGVYLKSVLSSPAGAAFGPILGLMVFAYLATRIVLYASAWTATDPINGEYQVPADPPVRPQVVVRPNYESPGAPRAGVVAAAIAVGAAISASIGWAFRR